MNRRMVMLSLLTAQFGVLSGDAAPTHLVDEAPVRISAVEPGVFLVDFGRVAFGNLRLVPPPDATGEVTVHFGERMAAGRIDRKPPGTVRYNLATLRLAGTAVVAAPPPDQRNTRQPGVKDSSDPARRVLSATPPAILTPPEWGVVLPFRWAEIEGWPGELRPDHLVRQAAYAETWDDDAAAFASSDDMLNRVWELCRYAIKATTFAGVYVDGDRERIPYEADAYLNQLGHYATDYDVRMARDTFDHLARHPTWPTEWSSHLVFMAHADWWHTGDAAWLDARFEVLRSRLLLERLGPDRLITSTEEQIRKGDLVDWPKGERDGFVFTPVNAVVNAFYLRGLEYMVEIGTALGRETEVAGYAATWRAGRAAFHRRFYDQATGLYRDGVGTAHSSLHANLFALAFGLVPTEHRAAVAAWLASRNMDCSVYAAQYFMEALIGNGAAERALDLMLAPGDRSWRHMVESGTTITWEAWDMKYKPNQDWNHAWGAAPANLLPRFVLGVQPLTPGWKQARIRPHPGSLSHARGRVPTPRGPVQIAWRRGAAFTLTLNLPEGMTAQVELPGVEGARGVFRGDEPVPARRLGSRWLLDDAVSGDVALEVR